MGHCLSKQKSNYKTLHNELYSNNKSKKKNKEEKKKLIIQTYSKYRRYLKK